MLSIMLSLLLTTSGLQVVVQSPAGCHPCYMQVDATDGLSAEPLIFQFDLNAGESFGHTVNVALLPGMHPHTESVRVRVWDGGSGPSADQSIVIPTPPIHRAYLPLIHGPTID